MALRLQRAIGKRGGSKFQRLAGLEVDEMAVYFAISVRTVYRLLDEGDLQATRIRGCLRISVEEITRFEEVLTNQIFDAS